MKREDVLVLAQLLHAMKEASEQLRDAVEKDDSARVNSLKKEILGLQRQVGQMI